LPTSKENINAKDTIKTSKTELNLFFKHSLDIMVLVGFDNRIKQINPSFERILGWKEEEVISKCFQDFLHPDDIERSNAEAKAHETGKNAVRFENRYLCKDGTYRWISWNSHLLLEKQIVVGIGRDITERKKAENALRESERRYHELFSSMTEMFQVIELIYDKDERAVDYCYRDVNPAFERLVGKTREQLVDKRVKDVFGVVEDYWLEVYDKVAKTGEPAHFEDYGAELDKWYAIYAWKPNEKQVATTFTDVTQRKKTEEALRESQRRLNRSQEIAHLGSWELDLQSNQLMWSDEVYRIFGLKPQQFRATYEAFLKAVHPDDRAAVDAAYSSSVREGKNGYEIEHRVVRLDGEVRTVHEKCDNIRDESGKIVRSIGMVQDITERKKADERLRESELLFSRAFQSSPTALAITRMSDNQFVEVNDTFLRLLGYQHKEIIGRTSKELNLFPNYSTRQEVVSETLKEGNAANKEMEVRIKSGEILNVLFSLCKIRLEGQDHILDNIVDVTERKKVQEALRQSEEKYRQIVETAEEGIWTATPDGTTIYVNQKMADMLGYTPEEIMGKVGTEFLAKGQEPTVFQSRKKLSTNVKVQGEFQFLRKDGTTLWTIANTAPIFEQGQHIGNIVMHTDITDRKKAEEALKRKHEELQTIIDASPTWIFYKDMENRFIRVNEAFAKVMGMPKEKLEGHSISEFYPQEQVEKFYNNDMQVITSKKPKLGIIEPMKVKEHILWVKTDVIPYFYPEGEIVGIIGFSTDITEQKERDFALRRQTLRFKLEDGNMYAAHEGSPLTALEAFKDLQRIGFDAVVISRICEVDFRKLTVDYSSYYWLAEQGKNHLNPTIEEIKAVMAAKEKNTVFLFDGLDYLSSKIGTQVIVSLIQWMKEYAVYSGNIILLPVNSVTFSPQELGLIEKETKQFETMLPSISEELLEILKLVHSKNKIGVNPNHVDIQNAFGFSRPTLKRKLTTLKTKEYLIETKMGNRKVLRLTQRALNLLQL